MQNALPIFIDPINLILACIPVAGVYGLVEGLRQLGVIQKGEYARKSIHIGLGVWLAMLPLFMGRGEIAVFCGLFFLGVLFFSGYLHRFAAYEEVKRWTVGQFLYPLSLMLVVFIFDNLLVFSFAVLELAFADGLAAVFGKLFGQKKYFVPGGYKTWIGSVTFFVVSLTLMTIFARVGTDIMPYTLAVIALGSLVLAVTEGLIAGGFDNLAVPLLAALIMNSLV